MTDGVIYIKGAAMGKTELLPHLMYYQHGEQAFGELLSEYRARTQREADIKMVAGRYGPLRGRLLATTGLKELPKLDTRMAGFVHPVILKREMHRYMHLDIETGR